MGLRLMMLLLVNGIMENDIPICGRINAVLPAPEQSAMLNFLYHGDGANTQKFVQR